MCTYMYVWECFVYNLVRFRLLIYHRSAKIKMEKLSYLSQISGSGGLGGTRLGTRPLEIKKSQCMMAHLVAHLQ